MYISLKLLNLYEFIARKQQKIGATTRTPYPIKIASGINAKKRKTCKTNLFIFCIFIIYICC
tara:strand:- start:170 stop:355 length:186 start_codon:yes stop_codon:yes gene_type:complete